MRGSSSRAVVRHLRTLYQFGVVGSFSDEQLLDRYLTRRDETAEQAFGELVQRHGPMVLGACRRILGDAHAAEDAFQATFLVLAQMQEMQQRMERLAGQLKSLDRRVGGARSSVYNPQKGQPAEKKP